MPAPSLLLSPPAGLGESPLQRKYELCAAFGPGAVARSEQSQQDFAAVRRVVPRKGPVPDACRTAIFPLHHASQADTLERINTGSLTHFDEPLPLDSVDDSDVGNRRHFNWRHGQRITNPALPDRSSMSGRTAPWVCCAFGPCQLRRLRPYRFLEPDRPGQRAGSCNTPSLHRPLLHARRPSRSAAASSPRAQQRTVGMSGGPVLVHTSLLRCCFAAAAASQPACLPRWHFPSASFLRSQQELPPRRAAGSAASIREAGRFDSFALSFKRGQTA